MVLFDLDHTLFDFEESKRLALTEVLARVDRTDVGEVRAMLSAVEAPLWAALEAGELGLDTLNELRWSGVADAAGLPGDPTVLAAAYLDGLSRNGRLLEGARKLLDALTPQHRLGLITNGYGQVQRPRLVNFDLGRYFESVTISGEIGIAKPDPRFFDAAMAELGEPDRATVLVVGDSLSSDMAGAIGYGLSSCWYNPASKPNTSGKSPDYEVTALSDVLAIATG